MFEVSFSRFSFYNENRMTFPNVNLGTNFNFYVYNFT